MSQGTKKTGETRRHRGSGTGSTTLLAHGEPMVWLMGGGLALSLLMIIGLLALVVYQGIFTFYPSRLARIETRTGEVLMGEQTRTDRYEPAQHVIDKMPADLQQAAIAEIESNDGWARRRLFRTGNFDLTGNHFNWVSDYAMAEEDYPEWAVTVERLTWGRFYGFPVAFEVVHPLDEATFAEAKAFAAKLPDDGSRRVLFKTRQGLLEQEALTNEAMVVTACVEKWDGPEFAWLQYKRYHNEVRKRWAQRRKIEKHDIGRASHHREKARLKLVKAELELQKAEVAGDAEEEAGALRALDAERTAYARVEAEVQRKFEEYSREIAVLNEENDRYRLVMETVQGQEKVLPLAEIVRAYAANQLSFGQKMGVYFSRWNEFLTADPREANMEGGVFPAIFGTVVMTLIMSVLVVPFGVLAALYLREYAKAGPMISAVRIAINNLAGVPSIVFGVFGLGFFCYLVGGSIDQLFFEAKLPSPTYGTGGIMWASFTLALLTLPVVIVATEEALSAVPSSMREGSYGCGASKWQTIKRIVLPRAMPGIMTGMILAMARGAGEVAPLMLVGAVKLAPELPLDGIFPFLHPERSFMHLGFHIYDLGFQSQNSEAAKPMVYTTTLLLITIVAVLNISAILIRNRLRKRFATSAF